MGEAYRRRAGDTTSVGVSFVRLGAYANGVGVETLSERADVVARHSPPRRRDRIARGNRSNRRAVVRQRRHGAEVVEVLCDVVDPAPTAGDEALAARAVRGRGTGSRSSYALDHAM